MDPRIVVILGLFSFYMAYKMHKEMRQEEQEEDISYEPITQNNDDGIQVESLKAPNVASE